MPRFLVVPRMLFPFRLVSDSLKNHVVCESYRSLWYTGRQSGIGHDRCENYAYWFEIFEETFAAGVIKRICLFREGLDNIQFIKQFSKCKGYVLWSSIRVKHQSSRTISGMICFLKGLDYQICIGSGWYIPRDNFSRKRSIMIQR